LARTGPDHCSWDVAAAVMAIENARPITDSHGSQLGCGMLVADVQLTKCIASAGCAGGHGLSVVAISGTCGRAGVAITSLHRTAGLRTVTKYSATYLLILCARQADFT